MSNFDSDMVKNGYNQNFNLVYQAQVAPMVQLLEGVNPDQHLKVVELRVTGSVILLIVSSELAGDLTLPNKEKVKSFSNTKTVYGACEIVTLPLFEGVSLSIKVSYFVNWLSFEELSNIVKLML